MASPSLTEEAFDVIWRWYHSPRRILIAEEFAINKVALRLQAHYHVCLDDSVSSEFEHGWPGGSRWVARVLLRTLLLEHDEIRRAANVINPTRFNQSTAQLSREERASDPPRFIWLWTNLRSPPVRVN